MLEYFTVKQNKETTRQQYNSKTISADMSGFSRSR